MTFAFWMCLNQLGELNLCRIIWLDSSISEVGTDGGAAPLQERKSIVRRRIIALAGCLDRPRGARRSECPAQLRVLLARRRFQQWPFSTSAP